MLLVAMLLSSSPSSHRFQSIAKEYGKQGIHAGKQLRKENIIHHALACMSSPQFEKRVLSVTTWSLLTLAHVRLDCVLDSPAARQQHAGSPTLLRYASTADIAETYFALHQQSPRGWTNEIDIRPFQEGWTC